jgi:hypothetical protein
MGREDWSQTGVMADQVIELRHHAFDLRAGYGETRGQGLCHGRVMPPDNGIRKRADRLMPLTPPLDAWSASAYNAPHAQGICDNSANYRPGDLIQSMDHQAAGTRRMECRAAPILTAIR